MFGMKWIDAIIRFNKKNKKQNKVSEAMFNIRALAICNGHTVEFRTLYTHTYAEYTLIVGGEELGEVVTCVSHDEAWLWMEESYFKNHDNIPPNIIE